MTEPSSSNQTKASPSRGGVWIAIGLFLICLIAAVPIFPMAFAYFVIRPISMPFENCAAATMPVLVDAEQAIESFTADSCGSGCWRDVTMGQTSTNEFRETASAWNDITIIQAESYLTLFALEEPPWYEALAWHREGVVNRIDFTIHTTMHASDWIAVLGEPDRAWVAHYLEFEWSTTCWTAALIWDELAFMVYLDGYNDIWTRTMPDDPRVTRVEIFEPDSDLLERREMYNFVLTDWQGFEAMRLQEP